MTMKRIWIQVHLWLGLTLGVLGVAIGITGTVLLYENEIDAALNPQRYAVTSDEVAQPYAAYVDNAAHALGGKARPTLIRLPQARGTPVTVIARAEARAVSRVYLDPPTARVLDIASTPGVIGWTRQLHEYLLMREFSGREIVGVVGFGMLVSSLTGLYLWWPARRRFREALGFRKGFALTRNLHYLFGCYGMLGLAALSFSGIFLAYPEGGRNAVAALAPVSPSPRNVQSDGDTRGRRIDVDRAASIAREAYPGAALVGIGLPMGPRGVYRVGMNDAGDAAVQVGGNTVVFVHPVEGSVLRRIDARSRTSGDAFLTFQRALHGGAVLGPAGRFYFALVGFLPALFVVTGTIMWLRRRGVRARAAARAAQPA